ncbi:MAG: ABC transporter ATP-binding protein [Sarcina sp.]
MKILEVKNLKKAYGDKEVVKGISFEVERGEILGFLGPNGAGKSTTINMLSTALNKNSGEIKFDGIDISKSKKKYKRSLGIVPQKLAIFEGLPAIENVKYFAGFYGLKGTELKKKSEEALSMVGLLDRKNDLPKTFSGGMKRRLNIACAIAHSPKLLILDEPTVGIDPQSRNHILESIKKLRVLGTTVIYTTHYMEEVEAICDRVIIIDVGEKIAEGSLSELIETTKENLIYEITGEGIEKVNKLDLEEITCVEKVEIDEKLRITVTRECENIELIIMQIMKDKFKIKNIAVEEASLETIFLNLTGRSLRD